MQATLFISLAASTWAAIISTNLHGCSASGQIYSRLVRKTDNNVTSLLRPSYPTSDKACYVPHGADTGAPDGHKACILCEAAQGVRCARAGRRSGSLGHPRPLSDNGCLSEMKRGNDSGSDNNGLFCILWNQSTRVSRGKTGEGDTGKRIIGTTHGQIVYTRGKLHNGAFTTSIGRNLRLDILGKMFGMNGIACPFS